MKKKGPTVKSLARSVKKINNEIELKWVDNFEQAVSVGDATFLFDDCLNTTQQGDTAITRDGNFISMTSVQLKLHVVSNPLARLNHEMRMILFIDRQSNGTIPLLQSLVAGVPTFQPTDVLDTSVIVDPTHAPYNRNQQKRYKILYDKRIVTRVIAMLDDTPAPPTLVPYPILINIRRKLGQRAQYVTNTGTITDIAKNAVWFQAISTVDPAVTPNEVPAITMASRLYFKDA